MGPVLVVGDGQEEGLKGVAEGGEVIISGGTGDGRKFGRRVCKESRDFFGCHGRIAGGARAKGRFAGGARGNTRVC